MTLAVLVAQMLVLTNGDRAGLPRLRLTAYLDHLAALGARAGHDPVLTRFVARAGFHVVWFGANVVTALMPISATVANRTLLDSPVHRANIEAVAPRGCVELAGIGASIGRRSYAVGEIFVVECP